MTQSRHRSRLVAGSLILPLLAAIVIGGAVLPKAQHALAAVVGQLAIEPASQTVEVGDEVTVTVTLDATSGTVNAAVFRVDFDPTKLRFDECIDDAGLSSITDPDDAACGIVNGDVSAASSTTVTLNAAPATVLTIKFTALAAGTTNLDFTGANSCAGQQGDTCGTAGATVTINDVGGGGNPGTVSFEEGANTVAEVGGTQQIQVNRTGGTETASATCTFQNGTATQGNDFNPIVTTVTWTDADNTPKFCTYAVVPDDVDEGASEQFTVLLGAGTGNPALGQVTTHVVTITDDDVTATPSAGSVFFNTASQNIGEGTNSGTIAVTRSGGVNTVVSVTCVYTGSGANPATPGTDFTAGVVNLTWTANENGTKNCVFVPTDDLIDEPDETFTATLTITQGNPSTAGQFQSHVVTIIDNDDPGVPGATQTPTATPTQVHPPVPTSTAVPEPTPTITPTATATFAGVPTNTPAGATHTPTNTQVPPSATPTRTNTVPAPMPPNTGTGTASSTDSGMSMLAILALIAVGVTVSGFAAVKVTRK